MFLFGQLYYSEDSLNLRIFFDRRHMYVHPSTGIYFTLAGVEYKELLRASLQVHKIKELLKLSQEK